MLREKTRRTRDRETERREQLRYVFLEQLYLLAGAACNSVAYPRQVERELEISLAGNDSIVQDLEKLGYLKRFGQASQLCITPEGAEYLRSGAWRRRTIRE